MVKKLPKIITIEEFELKGGKMKDRTIIELSMVGLIAYIVKKGFEDE